MIFIALGTPMKLNENEIVLFSVVPANPSRLTFRFVFGMLSGVLISTIITEIKQFDHCHLVIWLHNKKLNHWVIICP